MARDPRAPIIEGFDLSGVVNAFSYSHSCVERTGQSEIQLRDGSKRSDVIAIKSRISWTLNSASSGNYAKLAAIVREHRGRVSVTVWDAAYNTTRIFTAKITMPDWALAFQPPGMQPFSTPEGTLVIEEE